MLQTLRDLVDALTPAAPGGTPAGDEHTLQLATAVMLVEVMRADASVLAPERDAVLAALRETFALADDEAARLEELGRATSQTATDLFAFTTAINQRFEMADKLRMIEHMWRIAYVDGQLSAHERHVLWRIADLLHVPKGAYVHARLRAQRGMAAGGSASSSD